MSVQILCRWPACHFPSMTTFSGSRGYAACQGTSLNALVRSRLEELNCRSHAEIHEFSERLRSSRGNSKEPSSTGIAERRDHRRSLQKHLRTNGDRAMRLALTVAIVTSYHLNGSAGQSIVSEARKDGVLLRVECLTAGAVDEATEVHCSIRNESLEPVYWVFNKQGYGISIRLLDRDNQEISVVNRRWTLFLGRSVFGAQSSETLAPGDVLEVTLPLGEIFGDDAVKGRKLEVEWDPGPVSAEHLKAKGIKTALNFPGSGGGHSKRTRATPKSSVLQVRSEREAAIVFKPRQPPERTYFNALWLMLTVALVIALAAMLWKMFRLRR